MTTLVKAPTVADYQAIFDAERLKEYPAVDAFEVRMGFKIDRAKLEASARVLACPLKHNPPNWQHGRVLYAAARNYFASGLGRGTAMLDIGTAKGFSALCARWANTDAGVAASVWSTDVIDPDARVRRNTVAEVDGLKTLAETIAIVTGGDPDDDMPASIRFMDMTGVEALKHLSRLGMWVGFCFVDGKHSGAVVAEEGRILSELQQPGDLAIFDDIHLDDVAAAVKSLSSLYELETLKILPNRGYAIGVRRG